MFNLVFKKLDPLDLNKIYTKRNGEFINREYFYSELKKLFSNYLEDQLGLGEYTNEFIVSLFNKLKITLT